MFGIVGETFIKNYPLIILIITWINYNEKGNNCWINFNIIFY